MSETKLETERITMRLLVDSDISDIFSIVKKYPEMANFMTWNPPKTIEEAKHKFMQKRSRDCEDLNFGIFLKENNKFVGRVTVRNFHIVQQDSQKKSVFLSFWLTPEVQGKGLGTEFLNEVCRFCFEDLSLHKIFAGVFTQNIPSKKLLTKIGFQEIGLLRKHYLKNGSYYDSTRYELLEEDFFANKKPKKIAVFFKQPGAKDYPFNKAEYWQSYQELDAEISKLGADFYIVRDNKTYLGNGEFSKSWKFKDGDLIETGAIKADKVFDKGEFIDDGKIAILNNNFVNNVCTDKWKTYQTFPDLCPKTILTNDESEFLCALSELSGDKKVIKPIDEEEGNGVYIGEDEYLKGCPREFPLLVQEFLDTETGIPGIHEGIHDFRVAILDDEILFSFLRTPPEGELLANLALGGSMQIFTEDQIPASIKELLPQIKAVFEPHGDYFFGVDVGFVDGHPKIIELNSRLGLQENARHPVFKTVKEKLAKALVR